MSKPTAAQVPMLLTRARNRMAVINSKGAMQVAEPRDGEIFVQQDAELIAELHNQLATLAQAHADQQARLRALVGTWRDKSATDGLFIDVAFPGDTVGRIANQQRNRCADELEAVLNNS